MVFHVAGAITTSSTVNGVNLSGHVGNADAHHARLHNLSGNDHSGLLDWTKVNKVGSSISSLHHIVTTS